MSKKTIAIVLGVLMLAMLLPLVQPHIAEADERYLEINEANFPDNAFRDWIIGNLDVSGDEESGYYMTETQAAAVNRIDCSECDISSLIGIEHFTALQSLDFFDNNLTAVDISKNTALQYIRCGFNDLTALDIGNNTALEELWCNHNRLTELDLSKNTALTTFGCTGNQLTTLDVSNNTALERLYCEGNELKTLDLSDNTALIRLDCSENQLTDLDLSKNAALEYLDCGYNQLISLNVGDNTALEELWCNDNRLVELDVSNKTALKQLYCSSNQLSTLNVGNDTALFEIQCEDNLLTALDVSSNTALNELVCRNNRLTVLNVSNNTALEWLFAGGQAAGNRCLQNSNGVYMFDLTTLVPIECMANVTMQDASNVLDPATGIVTFPTVVDSFVYLYATGKGNMDVTVGLVFDGLSITTQPKSQTVANGKTAKFTVKVSDEDATYQWYYSKDNGANWTKLNGKTSATLSVKASATTNGYLYRCIAKVGSVKVTSKNAKLTVSGVKPKIVVQPKKATVKNGKSNTFKVVAAGSGLKYQWYYSKDNGTKWTKMSGKTSASLKIKGSATTNGYLYRCKITNTKGSVTSKSVKLTVSGVKPKIVVQPKAASVKSGKTAKFTVVAAGTGLKYQWYYSKNAGKTWTKMSGKTAATLSVKGSKTNNGYLYRCVVKNTKGSVTSKNAKLTVK